MRTRECFTALVVGLAVFLVLSTDLHAQVDNVDNNVIRLGDSHQGQDDHDTAERATPLNPEEARRGFDGEAFERRLESYWFRRKALLAEGRTEDADRQSELIRSFLAEEGVRRLDTLAGALVAEADRYYREGSYEKALASLDLAETLDPGRAQIHIGRAAVLWKAGGGHLAALREFLTGARRSLVQAWADLTLVNHLALAMVIALMGSVLLFSILMTFKYQSLFRHEVEERMGLLEAHRWGPAAGWALLLLPLLTWILAGWIALYWIVVTFRFMRRGERLAALSLLLATTLIVPGFRVSVALYGMMTDPAVRTTLKSASRAYSPDRIVELRELVDSHPEDPVYSFLLAGLYKDGRYFEEAYNQYRQVLEVDPANYQARINVGNIYYLMSQYPDAVTEYHTAIRLHPDSVLAYYNMYLAQSEAFRFKEAEESLRTAQQINSDLTTQLLSGGQDKERRTTVVDASIRTGSVWRAALEGRPLGETLKSEGSGSLPLQFLNAASLAALLSALACGVLLLVSGRQTPARRCIQCGHPFCHRCRSVREGMEYCSQCLHLFVIGDGLAPETKTKKLYEVERYERSIRRGRKLFSLLLPGGAHLLRGRSGHGFALIFLWLVTIIIWKPMVLTPIERLVGLDLHLDLLRPGGVPAVFLLEPSGMVALIGAVVVWLAGNAWLWRHREA